MIIPKPHQIADKNHRGTLYLKKNFPDFYEWLVKTYPGDLKTSARLYLWERGMDLAPTCPVCGKPTPYLDYTRGFQRFCSLKCSNNAIDVKARKVNTSIRKWGTANPSKSNQIKQKIVNTTIERHGGMGNASLSTKQKQQSTMKDRYGSEHALCNDELMSKMKETMTERWGGVGSGSKLIREKIENTFESRFGGYPLASPKIREKIVQTNLQRYGVKNYSQTEGARTKSSLLNREKYTKRMGFIGSHVDNNTIFYTVKCPHPDCNKCTEKTYDIPACIYYDRNLFQVEPCTRLLPIKPSYMEGTTLELFIRNILDEYRVVYETNIRPWGNKELDIYIPSKQLAIECNGLYFHSYPFKPSNYHSNKWKLCGAHDVQLLYFWEDQIKTKPEIVKSVVLSKLGLIDKKIFARKCTTKTIDSKTSNKFLNNNHLQGACKSSYRLGLYYGDELVGVMCFGNRKTYQKVSEGWELVRFCVRKDLVVVGGASKLFKYFLNEINPKQIISFSDNDISTGKLYKALGFVKNRTNHAYWYVQKQTLQRYHRSTFTKASMKKRGWGIKNAPESEIVREHDFHQIYTSGQTKWVWKSV